ncbi:threonine--tRNA ligase [bacterium]|nr:threonine--tRNA ligase [Candidatus Elulimicrobium humile]
MSEKISLDTKRHTGAHILATAIYDMFPEAQFGVGPTTENGFYYDVLLPRTLIPEDLAILESKMKEIIKSNLPVERAEMGIDEAIEHFREAGQLLKVELLQDLKTHGTTNFNEIYGSDEAESSQDKADVQTVSVYKIGNFVDLCRGPHIESTGQIDSQAFVLDSISASYFRGDQNRESMQRVYGMLFNSKKELKEFLHNREEAKKRDHRVLGKSLGLFTFSELVGTGLPLYTPAGTTLKNNIAGLLRQISKKYGSKEVSIPHIAKKELYEISGHAQKFSEELFIVKGHYKQEFALKPVNCPHHTQLFASEPRSYRDLPIRYIESTMQYRDEKPGQIGGLTRTRGFTVDDGHTFLAVSQIKDEVNLLIKTIADFYSSFGLWENKWVSLSVRDYSDLTKYTGIAEDWDKAEQMLEEIAKESGLEAKRCEGEAALYGPKLDFMFYDALGNERQLATIQLDFATPKRFELEYIDEAGDTQTPVMIHRAILGSYERFLAILIEHFAGRFPYWLAPVQVNVLSVNDSAEVMEYIDSIKQILDTVVLSSPLKYNELRYNLDLSSESLGKKIRNSELQKIPVTIIVGPKDIEAQQVSIRTHSGESKVALSELQEFLANFE